VITDTSPQEARFNALYTEYHTSIRKRIERTLRYSQELAEEIEQETWLKVWRKLPETKITNFLWLATIATHTAIDALRHKYKAGNGVKHAPVPPPMPFTCYESHYDIPIEEGFEAIGADLDTWLDGCNTLHQVFALMQEYHREICSYYLLGYSYKEIKEYGYSFGTIDYAIQHMHTLARKIAH
jgi:DNA-directed RNA polymerase specialized sigma24 family protein